MGQDDYVEAMNAMSRMFMFSPMFFVICNLGETVTAAFDEMDKIVYGISWISCPTTMQKYFVLILKSTQQPVVMKGIFSLDCSRHTFKLVHLTANLFLENEIIFLHNLNGFSFYIFSRIFRLYY